MSAGRRCRSCGARTVHRAHRQNWQRWLAWVVPLRPQRCIECGAQSWGALHVDEGLARYATATLFWLLVAAMLWPRGAATPPAAIAESAEAAPKAAPAVATPVPFPPAFAEATAEPLVETSPPPPDVASDPVDAAPPAEARQRAMRLDGIDVRWTGAAMAITIRGGDGVLFHTLRWDGNVQGYLLDLPGHWTLPHTLRMTRSFERSNLLRLRVGRHRDFLRIVFSLRDPSAPAPQIESSGGALRVLIH